MKLKFLRGLFPKTATAGSTEFRGKLLLQAVVGLNAILEAVGLPAVPITPETSLLVAAGLEALYMSWRQLNKRAAVHGRVKIAEANARVRAAAAKAPKARRSSNR